MKVSDLIDEIPGAYKDIDVVMDNSSDLVVIRATLRQVLCVKGTAEPRRGRKVPKETMANGA